MQVYIIVERSCAIRQSCAESGWVQGLQYFDANWEGSKVRVFHDEIVSPQMW